MMSQISKNLDGIEPAITNFSRCGIHLGQTAKAQTPDERYGDDEDNRDQGEFCRSGAAQK
jgi:hypothetical protein